MKWERLIMNDKFVLIDIYERVISTPRIFNTIEEAREAIKSEVIEALNGEDESIFDEYKKYDDYEWESDGDSAWLNYKGNSDWRIFSLAHLISEFERASGEIAISCFE